VPVNIFQIHQRGQLERTTCLVFNDHTETFNQICSHFVVLYAVHRDANLHYLSKISLCSS